MIGVRCRDSGILLVGDRGDKAVGKWEMRRYGVGRQLLCMYICM